MYTNVFVLIGLAFACQAVTIALCLRRARTNKNLALTWGFLAVFIWPMALLALLVTKPEPSGPGSTVDSPKALSDKAEAYRSDPNDSGMSVYTPFILNGVGLLLLFGLARGEGDMLGPFFMGVLLLIAANTGMLLRAFLNYERGLAVCYFLVLSVGFVLLLGLADGRGRR